jgi:hypothetical protein
VSQYVANLNQVPSPNELLESPPNLDFDNDIYANTDFIDWNAGSAALHDPSLDLNFEEPTNTTTASRGSSASEPKMDFNLNAGTSFIAALPSHSSMFVCHSWRRPALCFFRLSRLLFSRHRCSTFLSNWRLARIAANPAKLAASHHRPHASWPFTAANIQQAPGLWPDPRAHHARRGPCLHPAAGVHSRILPAEHAIAPDV